jgi:hypothetical protein
LATKIAIKAICGMMGTDEFAAHELAGCAFPFCLHHLERRGQWLLDLWLAPKINDSLDRRRHNDGGFVFSAGLDHVFGVLGHHLRRLVADQKRVLKRDGTCRPFSLK